jgi:hypothetical protein
MLHSQTVTTWWVRLYLSGPIETAKAVCRKEAFERGLCVTIEPTLFIYTGGEEAGYVVGLINYPLFQSTPVAITMRARELALRLLAETYQHSALIMTPDSTEWVTSRDSGT